MRIPCPTCGESFETKPAYIRKNWRTHCSWKCRRAARGTLPVERTCEQCGKLFEFVAHPSAVKRGRGRCCSAACALKSGPHGLRLVPRVCVVCGTAFSRPASYFRLGFPGNCCSKRCACFRSVQSQQERRVSSLETAVAAALAE